MPYVRLRFVPCLGIAALAGLSLAACDEVAAESGLGPNQPSSCSWDIGVKSALDELPGCPHPGDKVIDCSLAFDGEQTITVRLAPDEEQLHTTGGLHVRLHWDAHEFEGATFSVTAYTDDTHLGSTLFQVQSCGPVNQFHGMHGFTGLQGYAHPTDPGVGVQLACFVRAPDDEMTGWELVDG